MISIDSVTTNGTSLYFMAGGSTHWLGISFNLSVPEMAWWLLVIVAVLMAGFIYTKDIGQLVLGLMTIAALAVCIAWIDRAETSATVILLCRVIFSLLIAFVMVWLLYKRRSAHGRVFG